MMNQTKYNVQILKKFRVYNSKVLKEENMLEKMEEKT